MRARRSIATIAVLFAVLLTPSVMASALADPSGDAQQTVQELESQGYDVHIDRVGTGALSDCTVVNVRNPRTITQTIVTGHNTNRKVETVVRSKSITVSLDCSA
jgi:EAL domain-containing protein (putative c-di-GMP-specific phosphodiesterase class I)